MVTTGAISRAKLQSNHHQQTNTHFFTEAGCPSCHPTNSGRVVMSGKNNNPVKYKWKVELVLSVTAKFH